MFDDYDDYTAAHEQRPDMSTDEVDATLRELLITRKKLEIRTWFLRASIALNIGLITGFMVSIAVRL